MHVTKNILLKFLFPSSLFQEFCVKKHFLIDKKQVDAINLHQDVYVIECL